MAATSTLLKQTAAIKLHNGTTASGTVKTISVSMGDMSQTALLTTAENADKLIGIADAAAPILDGNIYTIETTQRYTVSA